MIRWYRAYEGTVTDAKLGEVALVAGCSRSVAIAAWHALLESAAATNNGGQFEATPRRVAVILAEPLAIIEAVFNELAQMGMIEGNVVCAWSRRQFVSDNSTERSRRSRNAKRNDDATLHDRFSGDAGALRNGGASPPYTETESEKKEKKESRIVSSETRASKNAGLALDAPPAFSPALPPVDRVLIAGNLLDRTLNPRAIEAARRIVEKWEASGWSVDLDIIPAVAEQAKRMAAAGDPPRSISVFEKWIGAAHAQRIGAPKVNGDPEEAKLKAMTPQERILHAHRRTAKLRGVNPDTELGIRRIMLAVLRNEDTFGPVDRPEEHDTVIPTAWLRGHFSDPRMIPQLDAAGFGRGDRLHAMLKRAGLAIDLPKIREKHAAYAASLSGDEYLDIPENEPPQLGEALQAV